MTFFEQLYIIVLLKQQSLPQKNIVKSIFHLYGLRKGAYMQKIYIVEKTMPCVFFQKLLKNLK